MQYVVVLSCVLAIAIYFGLPKRDGLRRNFALTGIGFLAFVGGTIQGDAALISWPMWAGTARGAVLGPIDVLAALLLLTRRPQKAGVPLWWLLSLYALPVFASLVMASVPMATAFSIWNLGRGILIFAAVSVELKRPGAIVALMKGLALGMILQAGYVIDQKLGGVVQAAGTFAHQNMLGMMVVLALLPMTSLLLEGNRNWLVMAGSMAGMIVIVGGGSRGAMGISVSALVILITLSLMRRRTRRKMHMLGLGVLAMAVVVPLGMMTLKDRFGGSSITAQEEQRAAFERAANAIIADHPWGIGANQFANLANVRGYNDRAGVYWGKSNRSVPVHNAYLLARAETGVAGLASLLLLFIVSVLAGLRMAFGHRTDLAAGVALGSAVAILAIAVHSNYEYAIALFQVQGLLMINIAIISGTRMSIRARKTVPPRARRPLTVTGFAPAGPRVQHASDRAEEVRT